MNIKQAADMFDLTTDTLRYYERVGVIPPIERDINGYRVYRKNDLNWIYLVKNLRGAGLSIESIIEFATLSRAEGDRRPAQKQILEDQLQELDQKIEEMNQVRNLLHYKIDTFDNHVALFEAGDFTDDQVEELWKVRYSRDN